MTCPFCRESIQDGASKCRFCGEFLDATQQQWAEALAKFEAKSASEKLSALARMTPEQRKIMENPGLLRTEPVANPQPQRGIPVKSDLGAFFLGLLLGPVGLWYKGHILAGFVWLGAARAVALTGVGLLAAPVFWFGMAIHAAAAKPI